MGNGGLISGAFASQTSHTGTALTTKGDIHGFSDTNTRVPISTNNFSLLCDSSESLGLKWAASPTSLLSAAGDILYASGSNTLAKLAKADDDDVLTLASGVPSWAPPATPSNVQYSVGTMSGVDFDFDSTNAIQTKSISDNTTFTGSNYAAGKTITLFITTDGTERDLAFPSGWIFMGTMPTAQAASKVSTLTLTCTSTTEASVRCAYAVEE